MGTYRSRLEIIADILTVVSEGSKKTKIMYQANLSYRLLSRYLYEVLDTGLVRLRNDDCYELTAKGKEFLDRFTEYSKRLRNIEQKLNHVIDEKTTLENTFLNAKTVEINCSHTNKAQKQKKA